MIRTPIKPFGFDSLEEFKEFLDKGFYNEQPVTVLKDDLVKLVDIAITATAKKKTAKKDKEKSEE